MKVREMMAELLEKGPDDELEMEVKVSLHANKHCIKAVSRSVPVTEVANGNTPVLLKADLTIDIVSEMEVY